MQRRSVLAGSVFTALVLLSPLGNAGELGEENVVTNDVKNFLTRASNACLLDPNKLRQNTYEAALTQNVFDYIQAVMGAKAYHAVISKDPILSAFDMMFARQVQFIEGVRDVVYRLKASDETTYALIWVTIFQTILQNFREQISFTNTLIDKAKNVKRKRPFVGDLNKEVAIQLQHVIPKNKIKKYYKLQEINNRLREDYLKLVLAILRKAKISRGKVNEILEDQINNFSDKSAVVTMMIAASYSSKIKFNAKGEGNSDVAGVFANEMKKVQENLRSMTSEERKVQLDAIIKEVLK